MYCTRLLDKVKLSPETRKAKQLLDAYLHATATTLDSLYKHKVSIAKKEVWQAVTETVVRYGDRAKESILLWGGNFAFSVGFLDCTTVNIITKNYWYTIILSLTDPVYKELIEHISEVRDGV